MALDSRVYIVGDRQMGIIVFLLNPLRAVMATRKEIEQYGKDIGAATYDAAFGKIAGALKGLISQTDDPAVPVSTGAVQSQTVGELVQAGTVMSDADFCFVSDVDSSDWKALREGFVAIDPFIGTLLESVNAPGVAVGTFSDQH